MKRAHTDDSPSKKAGADTEFESRTIFLVGDLEEDLAKDVMVQFIELAEFDGRKPIKLIINTYGGSVDEALALYDVMKLTSVPIHTVGFGKIMSAGCLLLAAGTQGQRRMGRNARLMYHGAWDEHKGDLFSHEIFLEEFKRGEKLYDTLVARETGRSLAEVEELYLPDRRNRYMDAAACKRFGFVDKLI